MSKTQSGLMAALVIVVLLGTLANPFAATLVSPIEPAFAAQLFPTVRPQEPDFDVPITGETPEGINLENFLLVGDEVFPIGDEFLGEPEIRLAGVQQDLLGRYGIATVSDSPDHRLIWITDNSGVRHNMIVHKDDPLYSGENGFLQHYNDYKSDLVKMGASMGIGVGGATTIIGLGLAGCVPSAGIGCAVAAIGGTVSILGGFFGELYFGLFEVKPAKAAMSSVLETIDANRGSQ